MYQIFDIALNSDIALPELPMTATSENIIEIQLGTVSASNKHEPQWIHAWKDSRNETVLLCARQGDDYLLRFPDLVDFLVTNNGNSIRYLPGPDVPENTIRHLLLDQVIPRVLAQRGELVLHASAIQLVNGAGVAFLSNTGGGKSTIASSFFADGENLITDDCLMIKIDNNTVFGISNYSGLRLYQDSMDEIFSSRKPFQSVAHYSTKKRLILHGNDEPSLSVPIKTMFLLNDPEQNAFDSITIEETHGADGLMAIIEQIFLLDVADKKLIQKQFRNASALIETMPAVFNLGYPRDHGLLGEVRARIEKVVIDSRM